MSLLRSLSLSFLWSRMVVLDSAPLNGSDPSVLRSSGDQDAAFSSSDRFARGPSVRRRAHPCAGTEQPVLAAGSHCWWSHRRRSHWHRPIGMPQQMPSFWPSDSSRLHSAGSLLRYYLKERWGCPTCYLRRFNRPSKRFEPTIAVRSPWQRTMNCSSNARLRFEKCVFFLFFLHAYREHSMLAFLPSKSSSLSRINLMNLGLLTDRIRAWR